MKIFSIFSLSPFRSRIVCFSWCAQSKRDLLLMNRFLVNLSFIKLYLSNWIQKYTIFVCMLELVYITYNICLCTIFIRYVRLLYVTHVIRRISIHIANIAVVGRQRVTFYSLCYCACKWLGPNETKKNIPEDENETIAQTYLRQWHEIK